MLSKFLRGLVVFLSLGLAGTAARAECPEGTALYVSWFNAQTVVQVAEVNNNVALYGLTSAELAVSAKQVEMINHYNSHTCGSSCPQMYALQQELQSVREYRDQRQSIYSGTQSILADAIGTEQTKWYECAWHWDVCRECD